MYVCFLRKRAELCDFLFSLQKICSKINNNDCWLRWYTFSWRLIMKSFLWPFSPLQLIQMGSCQLLAKVCTLTTGQPVRSELTPVQFRHLQPRYSHLAFDTTIGTAWQWTSGKKRGMLHQQVGDRPRAKPVQEQCLLNCMAQHDFNTVDWAVKPQTNKQNLFGRFKSTLLTIQTSALFKIGHGMISTLS